LEIPQIEIERKCHEMISMPCPITYSLESVMLVIGAMCGMGGSGGDPALDPCLEDIRLIITGLGLLMSFAK